MAEDFIEDIIASPEAGSEVASKTEDVDVKIKSKESPELNQQGGKESLAEAEAVKELAKQLGWREDRTGDDSVDAATYILRSKDIQKSMSQHNKDLKDQLQALVGSVEALKKHNKTVYKAEVKKLEAEVIALKKERKSAIELADVDKVEELDKQIDELQKDINAPKINDQNASPKVENPVYDEWIQDNDWYLKDADMAKFADNVAQQYIGAPLERIYAIVRTKVQEVFPDKFELNYDVNDPTTRKFLKLNNKVKSPIGPKSPVERSSAKGYNSYFTKADLTPDQVQIMNQFVRGGIMSEEAYINDIAKMQEA